MTAKKKKTAKPVAVKLSNNFQRLVRAGFDAAQTTKDNARHWSMADACSADAEARHDVRHTLRIRSRYEILNNSYARGVVNMLANDTIGTGPRLQFMSDDEALNEFQFTRPQGARLADWLMFLLMEEFQFTRPRGARRGSAGDRCAP